MHKMSKRTLNNSNSFMITTDKSLAIQTLSTTVVTPLCNSNLDEKSSRSHTVYYQQACEMQHKISLDRV